MKLTRETSDGVYRIRSYDADSITVNEERYTASLVLSLDQLYHPWPVSHVDQLTTSELEPALALEPEVVLLGTGSAQHFPDRAIMRSMLEKGIGVEVMDTPSACRTFNVLMNEGRRVVAALIMPSGEDAPGKPTN